jgi:hypothetical protein
VEQTAVPAAPPANSRKLLYFRQLHEALMLNSFDPNDMALLMEVVDQACVKIGGCDEATKAVIAARVLKSAGRGGRDFDTLLSIALYGSAVKAGWHAG